MSDPRVLIVLIPCSEEVFTFFVLYGLAGELVVGDGRDDGLCGGVEDVVAAVVLLGGDVLRRRRRDHRCLRHCKKEKNKYWLYD